MKTALGFWFRLSVCILFLFSVSPARAEQDETEMEFSIGVGGAVGTSLYKGYGTQWTPLPLLSFENSWVYVRGLSVGLKVINLDFLEVSVFAGYDPTSFKAKDSTDQRMRRLDNRSSSALAGLEARLLTPYGMLLVRGAGDILSQSDGLTGEVGYKHSLELGPLEFIPSAGLYWANSNYNGYYYGVSGRESRKSGLDSYTPGTSFSPYIGLGVDWEIDEQWDVFCQGEVVFPANEIKDSPMVNKSNSKNLSFGIVYSF